MIRWGWPWLREKYEALAWQKGYKLGLDTGLRVGHLNGHSAGRYATLEQVQLVMKEQEQKPE